MPRQHCIDAEVLVRGYPEYLRSAGEWGPYQKTATCLNLAGAAVVAAQLLVMFYTHLPAVPECRDADMPGNATAGCTLQDTSTSAADTLSDFCDNTTLYISMGYALGGPSSYPQDWDISCDGITTTAVPDAAFFAGWFLGGYPAGRAADRFGRRVPLSCAYLLCAFTLAATTLATGLPSLALLRGLHGMATGSLVLLHFLYGVENVPEDRAPLYGTLFFVLSGMGGGALAAVARALGDWRGCTLCVSAATLPFSAYPLLFEESPQFLYGRAVRMLPYHRRRRVFGAQRFDMVSPEAVHALSQFHRAMGAIAARNGMRGAYTGLEDVQPALAAEAQYGTTCELPPMPLAECSEFDDSQAGGVGGAAGERTLSSTPRCGGSAAWLPDGGVEQPVRSVSFVASVLRVRKLLRVTGFMTLVLFSTSLCSYGMVLGGAIFPGDVYVNAGALALIECVAYPLQLCLVQRRGVGRRGACVAALSLGSLCCLAASFTDQFGSGVRWFAFAGNLFLTAAFATAYIWAAEVFPSDVRGSGLGVCLAAGRLGSVATPFLIALGESNLGLAMQCFAAAALVGLVGASCLPETLGSPVFHTVEEFVEGRSRSRTSLGFLYDTLAPTDYPRDDRNTPASPEMDTARPLSLPLPAQSAALFNHDLRARPTSLRIFW